MENIDELDFSKENIQPLKKGRMVCQLGTALLAQADSDVQQSLRKEIEKHEILLRTYEGDDPLEPWYEYIIWVEQSFLKDPREGNFSVLLERCLSQFKDNQQYLDDKRYIELWIKYIEMSTNPIEVYNTCHAHNIGKYCAYFYMAWAYELEKIGDVKRANQVFAEGCRNIAQPKDELEEAHRNFELRVARQVLTGTCEAEAVHTEQRKALHKLKAHGQKKKLAYSVRAGENQRGPPGILQPISHHGQRSSNILGGTIRPYNDENDYEAQFSVAKSTLGRVPNREIHNRENQLAPGPWNGRPRKQHTSAVHIPQTEPSFKFHEDDGAHIQNLPAKEIFNALKPRKLDEIEFNCALAVFEPEDPTKRPMYNKKKVYCGGTEFSFEELRALEYNKGGFQRKHFRKRITEEDNELHCPVAVFEPPDPTKRPMYCKDKVYLDGNEYSIEELRAIEYSRNNWSRQKKKQLQTTVPNFENSGINYPHTLPVETKESDLHFCVNDDQEVESNLPSLPEIDRAEIFSQSLQEKHKDSWSDHDNGGISNSQIQNMPSVPLKSMHDENTSYDSSKMSSDSCNQSTLHGQSLTCNTKEALNIIHGMWTTPDDKKTQSNANFYSRKQTFCLPNSGDKFEVFVDEFAEEQQHMTAGNFVSRTTQVQPNFNPPSVFRDITKSQHVLYTDRKYDKINDENEKCVSNYTESDDDKDQLLSCNEICSANIDPHCGTNVVVNPSTFQEECIPRIPSPGMTHEEEMALKGTEDKENNTPGNIVPLHCEKRTIAGILEPSSNIPFDPTDDPAFNIEFPGSELEANNLTSNTQAFSYPLPSSTPFVSHTRQFHSKVDAESQESAENAGSVEACAIVRRNVGSGMFIDNELSTIVETTEYCRSSGSSGASAQHTTVTYSNKAHMTYNVTTQDKRFDTNDNNTDKESLRIKYQNASFEVGKQQCEKNQMHDFNCISSISGSKSVSYNMDGNYNNSMCDSKNQKTLEKQDIYKSEQREAVFLSKEGGEILQNVASTSHCNLSKEGTIKEQHNLQIAIAQNNCMCDSKSQETLEKQDIYKSEQREAVFSSKEGGEILQNVASMSHCNIISKEGTIKEQHNLQIAIAQNNRPNSSKDCAFTVFDDSLSLSCEKDLALSFTKLKFVENKDIDPFDHNLVQQFLNHMEFPSNTCKDRYKKLDHKLPQFRTGGTITLGSDKFTIQQVLGQGSYAKVFKVVDQQSKKSLALKVQKPSWEWELYICSELQLRLQDPVSALAFMDIKMAYILENGSVMVTDFACFGSLLSVINELRQNSKLEEPLMFYWMAELLSIAENLQKCQIIHGDIKPDNILLRMIPSLDSNEPSLQLIDMGRAIDMTLFPHGTTFNTVVTTKSFQCIEMMTQQPWTYHTDLYGIASTMHCICFGDYMKVSQNPNGRWFIKRTIPRYLNHQLWTLFFSTLLNVESCDRMPDLSNLRELARAEIGPQLTLSIFWKYKKMLK